MSATSIAWTDLTLNPVIGCTHAAYEQPDGRKVAHPGCVNCYAEKMCSRKLPGFSGHNKCSSKGKWTGELQVLHERLAWPFTRKEYQPRRDGKQRRCFLTSLSDMGHPGLAETDWMAVQGMMLLSSWITWQDLTKRPERQSYLLHWHTPAECAQRFVVWFRSYMGDVSIWRHVNDRCSRIADSAKWSDFRHIHRYVSVSDQATADVLIPELLKMPCAVRGVSLEPMIERVDLHFRGQVPACDHCSQGVMDSNNTHVMGSCKCVCHGALIDHVIVGGESGRGPGIRPFALEWALDVIEQCKRAGVWCFVKQMGSRPYTEDVGRWEWFDADKPIQLTGKGDNPLEWPEVLRVQQNVGGV